MTCSHHCRNTPLCGLAKADARLAGTKRKDRLCPSDDVIAQHGDTIERLREQPTTPTPQATSGADSDGSRAAAQVDNDESAEVEVVAGAAVFVGNRQEHRHI